MERERERLVEILRFEGVKDEGVLKAFSEIPRELFVPGLPIDLVYSDTVLITYRKNGMVLSTSSQPSLMARIMEELNLSKGDKVLEVGTGTGYNAAVISRVVGEEGLVVTVENDEELVEMACENMEKIGLKNVVCIHGDGYHGFKGYSPYDCIFITVGIDEPGANLLKQLKTGGKIGFPMNLYSFSWNPYFVMKKRGESELAGRIRFDTSFLRAKGNFAWREKTFEKILNSAERFDRIGDFPIPRLNYSFLEFLEICSLALFKHRDYFFIDLEERGYAILKENFRRYEMIIHGYANLLDEFKRYLKMWENSGKQTISTLEFSMRFEREIPAIEPSSRYSGQN